MTNRQSAQSHRWMNWSGSVTATPSLIRYPSSEDEIIEIVREARASGQTVRMVGSGHSFVPLVKTDDVLLSLDAYQGIVHVDAGTQQVTVRAGTKIQVLGERLFEHGLAQENLGDIDVQSIAGAISTGTHGSGAGLGSIATQVVGLKLVSDSGDVIICNETQQKDVFKAAQVSLGALGVITEVTLRCVPAYRLHYVWEKGTLADVLAKLDAYQQGNRHFEFFWLPYTDAVMIKTMNVTDQPVRPRSRFRQFNETVIENGALWGFSRVARAFPAQCARISRMMAALITGGSDVQYSHRIFATMRAVKFQEMEYNLPAENFEAALREIEMTIRQQQFRVHFPVECRFVAADDIPLSPAYGRDSAYIAVHMYRGMPYREYFDAMESIFRKYDGRPHWGKMHSATADDLRTMYPKMQAFLSVRERLDPDGIFLNDYLRRLLGTKETGIGSDE